MKKVGKQSVEEILEGKIEKVQRRREWKRFLVECVVVVAAVYIIFHYCIGLAFVSGHSMEPSLKDGELVVFYRLDQAYQPGDIVIIHRSDNIEYIKRVVAEPGDTVELSEEGALLVNGEEEEGLAGFPKLRSGKGRRNYGTCVFPSGYDEIEQAGCQ